MISVPCFKADWSKKKVHTYATDRVCFDLPLDYDVVMDSLLHSVYVFRFDFLKWIPFALVLLLLLAPWLTNTFTISIIKTISQWKLHELRRCISPCREMFTFFACFSRSCSSHVLNFSRCKKKIVACRQLSSFESFILSSISFHSIETFSVLFLFWCVHNCFFFVCFWCEMNVVRYLHTPEINTHI